MIGGLATQLNTVAPGQLPPNQYDPRNVSATRFIEVIYNFKEPKFPLISDPPTYVIPTSEFAVDYAYDRARSFRTLSIGLDSYSISHYGDLPGPVPPANVGFKEADRVPLVLVCPELQVDSGARYLKLIVNDSAEGLFVSSSTNMIGSFPPYYSFQLGVLDVRDPGNTKIFNPNSEGIYDDGTAKVSQQLKNVIIRFFLKINFEPNQIPVFGPAAQSQSQQRQLRKLADAQATGPLGMMSMMQTISQNPTAVTHFLAALGGGGGENEGDDGGVPSNLAAANPAQALVRPALQMGSRELQQSQLSVGAGSRGMGGGGGGRGIMLMGGGGGGGKRGGGRYQRELSAPGVGGLTVPQTAEEKEKQKSTPMPPNGAGGAVGNPNVGLSGPAGNPMNVDIGDVRIQHERAERRGVEFRHSGQAPPDTAPLPPALRPRQAARVELPQTRTGGTVLSEEDLSRMTGYRPPPLARTMREDETGVRDEPRPMDEDVVGVEDAQVGWADTAGGGGGGDTGEPAQIGWRETAQGTTDVPQITDYDHAAPVGGLLEGGPAHTGGPVIEELESVPHSRLAIEGPPPVVITPGPQLVAETHRLGAPPPPPAPRRGRVRERMQLPLGPPTPFQAMLGQVQQTIQRRLAGSDEPMPSIDPATHQPIETANRLVELGRSKSAASASARRSHSQRLRESGVHGDLTGRKSYVQRPPFPSKKDAPIEVAPIPPDYAAALHQHRVLRNRGVSAYNNGARKSMDEIMRSSRTMTSSKFDEKYRRPGNRDPAHPRIADQLPYIHRPHAPAPLPPPIPGVEAHHNPLAVSLGHERAHRHYLEAEEGRTREQHHRMHQAHTALHRGRWDIEYEQQLLRDNIYQRLRTGRKAIAISQRRKQAPDPPF